MTDIILSTQNGEPVVSSLDIAKNFGKDHRNVLQAIENKTAENSALLEMFHLTEYTTSQNKKLPMYLMNRDGFSFLVMGFPARKPMSGS
jgi:Rha family phage regulatory protein